MSRTAKAGPEESRHHPAVKQRCSAHRRVVFRRFPNLRAPAGGEEKTHPCPFFHVPLSQPVDLTFLTIIEEGAAAASTERDPLLSDNCQIISDNVNGKEQSYFPDFLTLAHFIIHPFRFLISHNLPICPVPGVPSKNTVTIWQEPRPTKTHALRRTEPIAPNEAPMRFRRKTPSFPSSPAGDLRGLSFGRETSPRRGRTRFSPLTKKTAA